ncbi:MAG: alpha/beta hydrolase [Chitinophagales bacterium]|nr:alpha/beta hydrolase [Chitinophagales bacterium]
MKILRYTIIVLTVLFVIVFSVLIFRQDETISRQEAIEKLNVPNSHFYDWNGINVHYTQVGDTGDVVLLVHGLSGSTDNFKLFTNKLKDYYRVYSIDLPAFGLTEVPNIDGLKEYDIDLIAYHQQFILDFLKEAGIDSCHIVGNSLGGLVSWEAVVADQSKFMSLTLLNSAGYDLDKVKNHVAGGLDNPIVKWIAKKGTPLFVSRKIIERTFYRDDLISDEGVQAAYYTNNKKGTLQWMSFLVGSNFTPDTADIATIHIPTLIVWGQQDELINVEHAFKFERDIVNSNLIIYDQTGHLPMIEQVDKLATDWMAFERDL